MPTDLSKNYPLLLNPNGDNVGIGTTEPGQKLEVMGALKLGGTPTVTPEQQRVIAELQETVRTLQEDMNQPRVEQSGQRQRREI